MIDKNTLKVQVLKLAAKEWDVSAIEARYKRLIAQGIPEKRIDRAKVIAQKVGVLDRIQRHAEEYEYLSHS